MLFGLENFSEFNQKMLPSHNVTYIDTDNAVIMMQKRSSTFKRHLYIIKEQYGIGIDVRFPVPVKVAIVSQKLPDSEDAK